MSVTSELGNAKSPIGRFFRDTLPNTRETLAEVRRILGGTVVRHLADDAGSTPYSQVGIAIDYRIRYHFAPHPRSGGWTVAGLGAEYVTQREDGVPHPALIGSNLNAFALSSSCVRQFFEELEGVVQRISPHRRPPTQDEERTLARFCLVLAALEAVIRGGVRAWPPPWFGDALPDSAGELLNLVPDDWVEDAAALGAAFANRHPAWLGSAAAVLNPVFVASADVGGGDADLIADRCLWEIKTERRARGMWLYQPLCYALLDYGDEYGIQSVGLLLPRHDTQISWPIEELITRLSGQDGLVLSDLRERFQGIVQEHADELQKAQQARIVRKLGLAEPSGRVP